MVIQLLPNQIEQVWDVIKFASKSVDHVPEIDAPKYFRELLISLLNGKSQCFVRVDEQKQLLGLWITRITLDEMTKERSLAISCLYSFKSVDPIQWESDLREVKKFAYSMKCKKLIAYSNNPRVFEIAKSIGFTERFRSLSLEV
jgi:hypothetical protein